MGANTAQPTLPRLILCEVAETQIDGLESFSPFCLKVHRALKVLGLPYERRLSNNPAAHKKHNPTGQVPVLLMGEEAIPDSSAILRRLESLRPGLLSLDEDRALQGEMWLWEEFADTVLSSYLVAARWADETNWPISCQTFFSAMPGPMRLIVPPVIRRGVVKRLIARDVWRAGPAACWKNFELILDDLDARVATRRYWVGSRLSFADLAIFAQLHSLRTPLTVAQWELVKARKSLSAYLDRIDAESRGALSQAA